MINNETKTAKDCSITLDKLPEVLYMKFYKWWIYVITYTHHSQLALLLPSSTWCSCFHISTWLPWSFLCWYCLAGMIVLLMCCISDKETSHTYSTYIQAHSKLESKFWKQTAALLLGLIALVHLLLCLSPCDELYSSLYIQLQRM